jgi:alditol oxidase
MISGPATNWAGNIAFTARRFHQPASLRELQGLVAGSERVRALGTGHSFNRIADTPGDLVSVAGLPKIMDVDAEQATVTISGGLRYGELAGRLHEAGYALRNLGSLPHISIAGACATGTHGSGDANGNLATAVSALQMVTAQGEIVSMSREAGGDQFRGAVVGLGALGIVTSMTLDIVPAFDVRQYVYEDLPPVCDDLSDVYEDLPPVYGDLSGAGQAGRLAEIFSSAYSVSMFTDWRSSRFRQVWLKRRADEDGAAIAPPRWMGALLADSPRHPVPGMSPAACTQQMGVPGPWHERLPHFRLDFTPSSGEELQSEYLVPRQHAISALAAIWRIRDQVAPVLQISEIRTVASDDLWMSPCYQRDSVAIHFTWIKDTAAVTAVTAALEDQLSPFEARPHWGKLFSTTPEVVRRLYPRLPDFQQLMRHYDPGGKFRNDFIDTYFP